MAKITVNANGSKALAKIAALEKAGQNLEPVFRTIGRALVARVNLCFKLGIDPWGSPWAALKIRKGQPLRDTGLLQRSIVARPDATGVTVGTNKVQAPVHQFGATIVPKPGRFWSRPSSKGPGRQPSGLAFPGPNGRMIFARKVTIPARPFLPLRRGAAVVALPPSWSVDVVRALRRYFLSAVEKVPA